MAMATFDDWYCTVMCLQIWKPKFVWIMVLFLKKRGYPWFHHTFKFSFNWKIDGLFLFIHK